MLRRGSVLLGLAVLLSLLFPVKALLQESGIDPSAVRLPAIDLAAACALLALLPSFFLFRDGRLAQRIPRWSPWVGALALSSLVFLLLHVSWSLQWALAHADLALVNRIEVAARLGVLVSAVGVLLNLDGAPDDDGTPAPKRRKK
jgi:hypothetical protein